MLKTLRLAVVPAFVAMAILPLTAMAAGMTLRVPPGTLHARIDITFNLKINCPAPAAGDSISQESWSVIVEEAAGTGIASGSAEEFVFAPEPMPFKCTGHTVTLPVNVLADVTGRPFHDGQAIVTAHVNVGYALGLNVSAVVGPKTVLLHS